jgi:hypothetical protein
MRKILLGFAGAALMALAPSLASAAPAALRSDAAPAVQKPIEQARMVRRCRTTKAWAGPRHHRHLVRRRACRMVEVR